MHCIAPKYCNAEIIRKRQIDYYFKHSVYCKMLHFIPASYSLVKPIDKGKFIPKAAPHADIFSRITDMTSLFFPKCYLIISLSGFIYY